MKETQTELPMYIDLRGVMLEPKLREVLKSFTVEAFPYEHQ